MRVSMTNDSIEVRLARWEKALGLMKDISVPLADVSNARFVEDPMRETIGSGLKAGLRLPWLRCVARTVRLDRAFVVRRGEPGIAFDVRNHAPLEHVLVSTPDARELVRRLEALATT